METHCCNRSDKMGHVSAFVRFMRLSNVCDEDIAIWLSIMKINYSLVGTHRNSIPVRALPGLVILPNDTEAWAAFHWEGHRLFRDAGEPETDALVLTRALHRYETDGYSLDHILSEAMQVWREFGNPIDNYGDILPKLEEMARILRPDLDLCLFITENNVSICVRRIFD